MMFEVQNGTVHSRNNPICQQQAADMEDQEVGNGEADDQRHCPHDQPQISRDSGRAASVTVRGETGRR